MSWSRYDLRSMIVQMPVSIIRKHQHDDVEESNKSKTLEHATALAMAKSAGAEEPPAPNLATVPFINSTFVECMETMIGMLTGCVP